jgi:protease-4
MNQNLHTLLSGAFYIDPMYAASCIPTLYKSMVSNSGNEKTIEELISGVQMVTENPSIQSTAKKVVILDFNQPVVKYDYGMWLGTQSYMNILKQLEQDDSVAGIVLNIDSGGGQVYGTGEIYDFIKNYSKPIVAFTHGYMCSGAYYIAAPTNMIIANKRADAIGSIGAYATIIDTNGIYEHFGAKVHSIYATKSTDKNSDYNEVIDNSNYEPYIKNQLDPIVETFIQDMKAVRPQLSEAVFNGGTWTGEQSLEMGLIDAIGTIDDAINAVYNFASKSNNNKNTNMNTNNLPNVQAVLGLDGPLASTEENGSYLNAGQLSIIEGRLVELESANTSLHESLAVAVANGEAQEQLTASQEQLAVATDVIAGTEASIDAILVSAGLDVTGTLAEKTIALNARVAELGAKDGAAPTAVKIDVDNANIAANVVGGVDVSSAMNN